MLNNNRTMREHDNFPTECGPPHHPQRKWIAPTLGVLILAAGIAIDPPAATADIIYTWHEDDCQRVTGSFTVASAAQNAGSISVTDFLTFNFNTPVAHFTLLDPSSFPISISKSDASPTASSYFLTDKLQTPFSFDVEFDTQWHSICGQDWVARNTNSGIAICGVGHWSIASAACVPEPSTATLMVIGAVFGLAYGWSRRRRAQQRQRPVGMPAATE